jgi:UDP:flavonoid glycosyltransferase YjiC (YdhE family)
MKITILAIGTRGDVQPYIALGLGLRAAGNDVRIAAASNFEQFIRSYGLEYARLEGNFRELMETDTMQRFMAKRNPLDAYREMTAGLQHILECFAADSWEACQDSDAIIFSSIAVTGYSVAEKLGIPSCWAPLQPMSRTSSFSSAISSSGNYHNGMLNWLSHIIEEQTTWQPIRNFINHWRRDFLGLEPYPFSGPFALLEKKHYPIIYGYSPTVLPAPPDWGDWIHISGYWFLDCPNNWQPPTTLVDFIKAGKPPIYIGFGSMNNREAEKITQIMVDAIVSANERAVIATGWGSLADVNLPDTIYKIDVIPHDWLFPQMAAAVHHGGAGTTAAALRAGIPNIIIPHIMDQSFWGQRVFELGVGTHPIHRKNITAGLLADSIRTALKDKDMRQKAAALGKQIRAEDGVAKAVELMTCYLYKP